MLRIHTRWHDAANGPLHGEARLLWFAAPNPPAPAVPDPDDEYTLAPADPVRRRTVLQPGIGDPEAHIPTQEEEAAARKAAEEKAARRAGAEMELFRRRAESVVQGDADTSMQLEAANVVARAQGLQTQLESHVKNIAELETAAAEFGESHSTEIAEQKKLVSEQARRINDVTFALTTLQLERWESGEMTPGEFLANYRNYVADMEVLDNADARLTPERRTANATSRARLLADTEKAVSDVRAKHPERLPLDLGVEVGANSEQELWKLYTKQERQKIIDSVSEAAGVTLLKASINANVEKVAGAMDTGKFEEKLLKFQRTLYEREAKKKGIDDVVATPSESTAAQGAFGALENGWIGIESAFHQFNQAAGIEWMTLYEWYEAFNEVIESITEVKKRKSRGRIARAALQFGRVAALVPGLGGTDLLNVLEEQQQNKNDEVKDSFIKELKNNRVDYGFKELFGDNSGKRGLLAYYRQLGDTNRTRAILEFAAGKGLLYEIGGNSWDKYMLPGGVPFRDLMPSEWSDNQVDTWFGNLQFSNTQGMVAQEKAGEDFVKGRATMDGYLGPFKGAIGGLSLWFAKGIANKALSKVKEGEMSSLLMLAVLREWETNDMFRRYVDMEWLDRLAGDSKQLMIGMIKYDKGHLIEGARGKHQTRNIAEADAKAGSKKPEERGKQRLGPLVSAVRKYIVEKDSSIRPSSSDEKSQSRFDEYVAQVLSCKLVTLPNGKKVSIFAPALRPYHIKYEPNEMRDAAVDKIGDDFFIERSELVNSTAEVMQYIGKVRDDGFAEPTKARYFFSHIIDTYNELVSGGAQDPELARAAQNFKEKIRPNLDQWATRNLQAGNGSDKLLTEYHSDQGLKGQPKRLLVLALLKLGLIPLGTVQQLAAKRVKAAVTLLDQYNGGA